MVSKDEMDTFLKSEFPQTQCTVESLDDMSATVRHPVGFNELRPGGTVSGPVLNTDPVAHVVGTYAIPPKRVA
jgi:acyl-coenzyme A thioesterase PaaI-like protein